MAHGKVPHVPRPYVDSLIAADFFNSLLLFAILLDDIVNIDINKMLLSFSQDFSVVFSKS